MDCRTLSELEAEAATLLATIARTAASHANPEHATLAASSAVARVLYRAKVTRADLDFRALQDMCSGAVAPRGAR